MTAQDNVALARSLLDLYNNRRSDPAWLDKTAAAFAEDSEYIDIPSGATLRGPYGYRRLLQFFVEGFPDSKLDLINAFAEEDQVMLETTARWNNIDPKHLPQRTLQPWGAQEKCGCARSSRLEMGKSSDFGRITI